MNLDNLLEEMLNDIMYHP